MMEHKLYKTIVMMLIAIFSNVTTLASDQYENIKIEFSNNSQSLNKIGFTFNGKIYDEKYTFSYIEKRIEKSIASDVEKLIYKNIKYNKSGEKEKIIRLWEKKERNRLKKLMSDPEGFNRNQAFFRNIISSKLMAVVLYDTYILCYINHNLQGVGSYIKVYPMIQKKDGELYLTNALSKDYFFSVLSDHLGKYIHDKYQ